MTLVGDTPYELQLRKPVKDSFSATFKAGAQYQKCDVAAPKWEGLRNALRLSCGQLRSSLPPSARLCSVVSRKLSRANVGSWILMVRVVRAAGKLMETVGCDAGTALPLLWCVELIPDGENNSYRPPHPMCALGTSQIFWPELEAFPELCGRNA